ncbi:hypothetical protein B0G76_4753 [Paraburkholderia sp. BL23I1N1]|nr:hypothetical protein B0G76_4753 [Paraburkholderia sp. BL23I1N1]
MTQKQTTTAQTSLRTTAHQDATARTNVHHTRRTNRRSNTLTGIGQRVIPHARGIGRRALQQRAWILRREARCITTR